MAEASYPLMTLFGRTLKFLTDEYEARLRVENLAITVVEFVLLYRLSTLEEDKISQQNFAQLEGKHKTVIMRQIDGLEQKRLVARLVHQADRRKHILALTRKGHEVLQKALKLENAMMREFTEGLSEAELRTLKEIIFKIQANAATKARV